MNFIIISNEIYAVRQAGYRLKLDDLKNDFHVEAGANVDGFFDLDDTALCKGKDGKLYAVGYKNGKPIAWLPVIKGGNNNV